MTDSPRNKIDYTIACINEFAEHKEISPYQAFSYLYNYKGLDFIEEHYNIEHTLSFDDVVNDLEIISTNNEGKLDSLLKVDMVHMYEVEQLMEYVVQDIVSFIIEERNIPIKDAIYLFYTSDTYSNLMNSKTGLYLKSFYYVYDIFKDEE